MNLGIFLSSGESFKDLSKSGQDVRFKKYYLVNYSKNFDEIYIFSYGNEKVINLPKNVNVVPNKYKLNRHLYGIFIPIINYKSILKCDVFRVFHLLGTLPAIMTKVIYNKPFVYNYGYDYVKFSLVESKYLQVIFIFLIRPLANFFASKIIGVTQIVFKWIPKQKLVYIPNWVDTLVFKPSLEKKIKKQIIVSVGRFEKQKNYPNLIKSVKNLDVKLILIGRGILKRDLLNLAKEHKVDLEIIESIPNDEMPKIYNRATLFVLPSLIEGFPKVVIEAMSCGLPVICTRVGGLKEMVRDGETGIFSETSVESIREKIVFLLNNARLRTKLGNNARRYVISNYDISNLIRKEIKVLSEI